MNKDLSPFATPDRMIEVRLTPKASRNAVSVDGERLKVSVTAMPEGGKANAAVVKVLSKAIGVPKSRLELVRGATSRDKLFRVLAP